MLTFILIIFPPARVLVSYPCTINYQKTAASKNIHLLSPSFCEWEILKHLSWMAVAYSPLGHHSKDTSHSCSYLKACFRQEDFCLRSTHFLAGCWKRVFVPHHMDLLTEPLKYPCTQQQASPKVSNPRKRARWKPQIFLGPTLTSSTFYLLEVSHKHSDTPREGN